MRHTNITLAKSFLGKDNCVFVIAKDGDIIFRSFKKGIQPFFDALEVHPRDFYTDCSIADRVIGKAALMLAAYLGAKEVYTPLASQHAVSSAKKLNLDLHTMETVPYIINRSGDGMCPMENAVIEVENVEIAFEILKSKLV